jgi:hypothetical protein
MKMFNRPNDVFALLIEIWTNLNWIVLALVILGMMRSFGIKPLKLKNAEQAFIAKRGDKGAQVVQIHRKASVSQATYLHQ